MVIPLYNKERYIKRTLDSVLCQTLTDFECIIVDSSDDRSTCIVSGYSDPRIRHIVRESRVYLPIARNIGIQMAKSELVAFIDADDEWLPDHLEVLHDLYTKYPHGGIYATPYLKIRPDYSPMTMVFADIPQPPWQGAIQRYFLSCSKGDVPVSSSSCAIRRELLNSLGGFDEDLIFGGEDQYLWSRIALEYQVFFTWRGLAIYHTEASGRMCHEPHKYNGDPLSDFLNSIIEKGSISSEIVPDIIRYISKRRNSLLFSSFIYGTSGVKETTGKHSSLGRLLRSILKKTGFSSLVSCFFQTLYHSRLHDIAKKFRCKINGWYIPNLTHTYKKT